MPPVKVGDFSPLDADTFEALRYTQPHTHNVSNPRMVDLLELVSEGEPVQVMLLPGQTARTLRSAVSNSARSRGLKLESLVGDGYVAFRLVARVAPATYGRPKK